MSVNLYKQTQNASDSPIQLSIRAIKSVLLYCQDWSDKELSEHQKLQAINAGQQLCDAIVENIRIELPEKEQILLMSILTRTSVDLFECTMNQHKSLIQNEHALINLIDILERGKKII